jgi:hypothetical protein
LLIHLLVYSLVHTEFFVTYVSVWQSTLSRIVVALVEMMSSEFIYACLVEIYVLVLVVTCLTCLFISTFIKKTSGQFLSLIVMSH